MNDPASMLRAAQSRMARALLGGDHAVDPRLGELTLRPHQITAVGRLLEIIASHRGALLADAVGLGKTYVALAIAREYEHATIICPAALRGMWQRAMTIAGRTLPVVSIEAISRGWFPQVPSDLLIIDEAHHLRTPGTRRYEGVAHMAKRARVLLLSATPLHNSRRDLTAVLALFAGTGVNGWSDRALARLIVRRDDSTAAESLPPICGPHSVSPGADDDCLDAILGLPPAIPAADEGVAHALATISLIHLWTSSRAALVASARKRLARATALRDAVDAGHMPTAAELSAWSYADGALQLAFPLFASGSQTIDQESLAAQLERFIGAARALIDRCQSAPDPDEKRVEMLRALRARHHGARIVAFSQYAHTITALGRLMRSDRGIALVTASGARIASGSIDREDVLKQFALDAPSVHDVERIDLLLTTDLLSEGIDLRGASVIVHLDLPWNPARMEQRVGRSRRLGSPHREIHVYTFVPPTAAERLLELRRRLTEKVRAAQVTVGGAFDPFGDNSATDSPVAAGELLRAGLRQWSADWVDAEEREPVVAAAVSEIAGWIAAVVVSGVTRLIGDVGAGVTEDSRELRAVMEQVGGPKRPDDSRRAAAFKCIHEWMAARRATAGIETQSPSRRAVLDRLSQTVARVPRHRRSAAIAVAQRTRHALERAVGVGSERVLSSLARSTVDDDAWLQCVDAFGAIHVDDAPGELPDRLVAVILLETISAAGATPE